MSDEPQPEPAAPRTPAAAELGAPGPRRRARAPGPPAAAPGDPAARRPEKAASGPGAPAGAGCPHLAHGPRHLPDLRPAAHRRRSSPATPSSTSRPPTPPPPRRATSTCTPTAPSSPATARSTGRTSRSPRSPMTSSTPCSPPRTATSTPSRAVDPKAMVRAAWNTAHRQGHPGRLHHHPAVRQELLPRPGTDRHPQGQGVLHLDQARPRGEQGRHPRGLPQHQLLRPQRLRHPGRRPGLLRQERPDTRPRPGRLPRRPAQRPQRSTTWSRTPRTRPRALARWNYVLDGMVKKNWLDRRRAGRAKFPCRQGQAARPGIVRPARLHRRRASRTTSPTTGSSTRTRSRPAATASPPPSRSSKQDAFVKAVERQGDCQARAEEPQGRPERPRGRRLRRPDDRQGRRDVRRHRLHQAVRQQRDPRATTRSAPPSSRSCSPRPSQNDSTTQDGADHHPEHPLRRHQQAPGAGLERAAPTRRTTRTRPRTATSPCAPPPTSPSTRCTRRWPWTSAPTRSSRPPSSLGIPADTPDLTGTPSIALGPTTASVLDMAEAYATLANHGRHGTYTMVESVTKDGEQTV